jgi:hypothetical protein
VQILYITDIPYVFTDSHADSFAIHFKEEALFSRLKISGLIKDIIAGQQPFAAGADDPAIM